MTSKPWMKFYPADWQADPAVRSCSLAARGLWIEMLCIMQKADPVGRLTINGNPPSNAALAVLTGSTVGVVVKGIRELETASGDRFRGRVFIDATYEGDLLAASSVSYTVGREANSQYGETVNGTICRLRLRQTEDGDAGSPPPQVTPKQFD